MSNSTTIGNKMSDAGSTVPHMLWLPSVVVATVMFSCLGMSFTRHIRRVKRKKQILMDYVSLEIDVNRCRISANLCNTYSMPLRQLASSMRIHVVDEQDSQAKTVRYPCFPQQHQSAVPTGRVANRTPRGGGGGAAATRGETPAGKDVSIELDSPDSEFPTDTDECVKIKIDLLCDKCREHILTRPMFYLSEDSQSMADAVAGKCVNQGIIIEEEATDNGVKTVRDVRSPLFPFSRYISSITSEEDECDRNWTPLLCRVPTVIVTDMSDIELDLFQQETISMESIDYDYTQSSINRPNHRNRATVLLSTEDIIGHFDAVANECTKKLSYDDLVMRRSRISDNSSADSPEYKSPKGARGFFTFFSKRKRRKTTKTVRKPVLTKQDKIGPIRDLSSRSLEDVNRQLSLRGRTWNLGQRRKRFARTKPEDNTVSSDMDPNHSNDRQDVNQSERSTQSWTNLQKSNSADSNRSEISKPRSFESQVTFLEDHSIRQKRAIEEQGKTRSCDEVMQDVESSATLERVTLTHDGGCHRTKSVDSNLRESFRLLTYFGEHLGSGSRSDG